MTCCVNCLNFMMVSLLELLSTSRHSARLRNRGFGTQAREPFRLVYSKGRLVGVLEPFADLYQLAPVSSQREGVVGIQPLPLQDRPFNVQVERSEESETDHNENVRYTDENYPMILTNFKIDSKINAKHGNWRPSHEDNHHQDTETVKTTLGSKKGSAQSDSPDKLDAMESDLRGLIRDLGLTDTVKNERRAIKRDTNIEDEDLEEGPNNIQIVKATHDSERKKRAEFTATEEPRSTDQNFDTSERNKMHGIVSEKSSPVAISNTEKTMEDYEKQFEKKIQQRIDAIKEEVKREIASAQTKSALVVDNPQRSKRGSSSSLQEVESMEIDSLEHPNKPLARVKSNLNVRTKRDAFRDAVDSGKQDENTGAAELTATTFPSILDASLSPRQPGTHQTLGMSMLPDGVSEPAYTESVVYDHTTRKPSRKRRAINLRNVANVIHRRKKRAEALMPDGNVAYLPYRAEDEEIDEEGDEFEDDGFDDRSASHFRRYSLDYQDPLEYEEVASSHPIRKYFHNSDVYDDAPSFPYIRRKRRNFAALQGGSPTRRHFAAIGERQFQEAASKNRNSQPTESTRGQQQRISDLSDTELFGALPQSYEGELSRFKRVKRKIASPKGEG